MAGKKKLIIILGGLGLLSFAASVVLSMLGVGTPEAPGPEGPEGREGPQLAGAAAQVAAKMPPGKKRLEILIKEVRMKAKEYNDKLTELGDREKRVHSAEKGLKTQADELGELRVKVASLLPRLKDERKKLNEDRILITQEEAANAKRVAAMLEKGDPAESSKIIEGMLKKPDRRVRHVDGVLLVMSEESLAGVLAEMEADTATMLAEELNRIRQRATELERMDPGDVAKNVERSMAKPKGHEDEDQDDQVKYVVSILVAMSERSSVKILEAMDKALAAMLCEQVKKFRQEG